MSDVLVDYSADRGIARIALDSPRNRNALSAALMTQLDEALAAAAADDGVRAVELTHTGSTFCAGADLAEAREAVLAQGRDPLEPPVSPSGRPEEAQGGDPLEPPVSPSGRPEWAGTERMMGLLRQIIALPKPVVASIDGHVRAGGMGLVGACDIAIAGPASTFAFSEVRLGLAPAIISLTTLPRLSARAASRYYLTGETFDAATAARIGLITEAVADIDAGTMAVLDPLRAASPQGLAETKPLLTAGLLKRFDADGEALVAQSARLFGSAEAAEGMAAFLAKRPPRWAV